MRFPSANLLAICLLLAGSLFAAEKSAVPVVTPLTLPDAETFVYREDGAATMRLFVVKPAGWKASDRRPGLMFFFGGGWTTGTAANSVGWAKHAAQLGFVGIAPDYRTKGRHDTSPSRPSPTPAPRSTGSKPTPPSSASTPNKSSSVATPPAATSPSGPRSPPTRPAPPPPKPRCHKPAALFITSAVSDTSTETGYTPKRFGADTLALSPVHQLDAKMPPVLAFHGDADKTVPLAQSLALRDKLIATGNTCELHIVPGGGHNYGGDVPSGGRKPARSSTTSSAAKSCCPELVAPPLIFSVCK